MRDLGINVDKVAKSAKGMGLSFDENKFKTMSLYDQLKYLFNITHGNKEELLKLTGGAPGFQAAMMLMGTGGGQFSQILKDMGHSAGMTANAFAVHENTMAATWDKFKASLDVIFIQITNAIKPVATTLMDFLMPPLKALGDWAGQHGKLVGSILAGLAVIIGGVLVAALWSFVSAAGAAAVAALPIVAPIAAVVAVAMLLVTHWNDLVGAFKSSNPVVAAIRGVFENLANVWNGTILPALKQIWGVLQAQFTPILNTLKDVLKNNLIPAWNSLKDSFNQILPVLKFVGIIIGVALVAAFTILVGVIKGVIGAIGPVVSGIAQVIGGLVTVIAGGIKIVVSIVAGIFTFLNDLIHGNFGKLGPDLLNMLKGIGSGILGIFSGLWNAIKGIFSGAIGGIFSIVSGLVGGIINFFKGLWDKLTGHSIIPDMIGDIINFFGQLPGKLLGLVGNMVSGIASHFADLLKNIPIVGSLVSGAQNLFSRFVNNTADQTAIARDKAAMHTDEMRIAMLTRTAATQIQAAAHFDVMRVKLIDEIKNTKDPVKRHALEMQLGVVEQSEQMHKAAADAALKQRTEVTDHFKHLSDDAKMHAQHMKEGVAQRALEMVGGVLGQIGQLPGKALTFLGQMASNILKSIGDLVGNAAKAAGNVVTGIANVLGNLGSQALQWGKDMIGNFINGIKNMAGGVVDAIKNIAGGIASFFGFSVPEQGPLSSADVWMDHFGDLISTTMGNQHGKLTTAARKAAGALQQGFGPPGVGLGASLGVSGLVGVGGGGAGSVTHHITHEYHFHLDASAGLLDTNTRRFVAQQLAEEIARQTRLQGRSGPGYTGNPG